MYIKTALVSVRDKMRRQPHWGAVKVRNWLQRMGNKSLLVAVPGHLIWTSVLPLGAGSGPGMKLKFEAEWVWKWVHSQSPCTHVLWHSWQVPQVLQMRGRRWTQLLSGQFVWTHPLEYYHTESLQPMDKEHWRWGAELIAVCVVDACDHKCYHSSGGVRWTGLLYGLKTDGIYTIWAITVHRPLKRQRTRKKGGATGSPT